MSQNKTGTSKQTKQNSIKIWWHQQLMQQQQVSKQPRHVLSDSFACFTIALSLLFFYFIPSYNATMLFWIVLGISLFFAFFLISVANVEERYPKFYLVSSWFDDMLFVPWILVLTPAIAYIRLLSIYKNAIEASADKYIYIVLFLLGAYYITYIFVFSIKSFKATMKQPKAIAIQSLWMMSMMGLLFLWLIMLIDHRTWISAVKSEIWSYIAVLIITVLPLIKVTKTIYRQPIRISSALSFISLAIISIVIILFFSALCIKDTSKDIRLLWSSSSLIIATFIILGVGMYLEQRSLNTAATNK